jgi:membrane-associated protein
MLWAVGMVLLGHAAATTAWVRDAALWAMAVSVVLTVGYVVHALRRRRARAAGVTGGLRRRPHDALRS